MTYVTEFFEHWRSAPAGDPREDRTRLDTAELMRLVPALQRDPGEAIWPNGKRGRDCVQQDFDDVGGWLRALLGAANALTAAVDLRLAVGGLKI